ncbi:heterokaryon incompatibility protein-domain-containing protein [Xylariaceae sp. FL1651]|nr:heterokaryon incompatibility protein-domain-containing protein [Xylariaceae sp. FL1651]
MRMDGSHLIPNEFKDQVSDNLGDGEASSKYRHAPLLDTVIFEYPPQKLNEGIHLYEALSYVWGSEHNQQPAYIQSDDKIDRCLLVTANLHTALSNLRDPYFVRTIWIDAICINQKSNEEKGQQVQSMPKIYAKASCVIVWLGEAAARSDQALKEILNAADQRHTNSVIGQLATTTPQNQQAILALLKRPWFERIWVLQEVAAARRILIKCGPMEIDGQAFCLGLRALDPYQASPALRSLICSVSYLIEGAAFRPRHDISRSGRFSLNIRPLSELVDMYHDRKAMEPLDRVYALLEVFRKLVNFSLSDRISVDIWDSKTVAVIKGSGSSLSTVSSVERNSTQDDRQRVCITWNAPNHGGENEKGSSHFAFQASAKPIEVGDIVCLLQGALKPTIVRLPDDYMAIIISSVSLINALRPVSFSWSELLKSITAFTNDLLLIWEWDESQRKSRYKEDDYDYFTSTRGPPRYPKTEPQAHLDKATRLWNMGLFIQKFARHPGAEGKLFRAMQFYEMVLESVDNSSSRHSSWRTADVEGIVDILTRDGGYVALSLAAQAGHKAIAKQLLNADKVDPGKGLTPLAYAAADIVRLSLESHTSIWSKGKTMCGNEVIMRLLLDKCVDFDDLVNSNGQTPLLWAVDRTHETIVQMLLEKGANYEAPDIKRLWLPGYSTLEAIVLGCQTQA